MMRDCDQCGREFAGVRFTTCSTCRSAVATDSKVDWLRVALMRAVVQQTWSDAEMLKRSGGVPEDLYFDLPEIPAAAFTLRAESAI